MPLHQLSEYNTSKSTNNGYNPYTASIKSHSDSTTQFPPENRRLEDRHRKEWEASAIAIDIIEANLYSLRTHPHGARDEALELLYDLDQVERDNIGRVSGSFLRRHNNLNDGGWWARGMDLATGKRSEFLTLKPDSPRRDREGKTIKYEHPRNRPTEIFAPAVGYLSSLEVALKSGNEEFQKAWLQRFRQELEKELAAEAKEQNGTAQRGIHSPDDGGQLSQGETTESGLCSRTSEETARARGERGSADSQKSKQTTSLRGLQAACERGELREISQLLRPIRHCKGNGFDQFRYVDSRRVTRLVKRVDQGFWESVKQHPIRVTITEGFKKAGSLLAHGECAIGLPGVWNWIDQDAEKYFNNKGELKRRKELTRHLKPLTQIKREFVIAFDEDSKLKTRKNVDLAQKVLGKVVSHEGGKVSILSWNPEDGKGIDDAIAKNGSQWLEQTYQQRLPLSAWLYWKDQLTQVDYRVNKPFLTKTDIPTDAKLIGIKSAKGTGKTEALAQLVNEYQEQGVPVFVLTHRVQLVKELADRFGMDSAYNLRDSDTGGLAGLALCVDSLHKNSQVQFNPELWDDGVVIVDEAEQVFSHLLTSNGTDVAKHRIEVLSNVSALCQCARHVILSDADLSDSSLRYAESIMGTGRKSILCNDFQKSKERKGFIYNTPETLLQSLHKSVQQGEKALICTDSQKAQSKWGSISLESYFKNNFPNKKVIRIDSETVGDIYHPAYRITEQLEEMISGYDVVIYTPVLSTGVSIDLPNYFDNIYSFNQGTQSENSTRQMLGRLRDNIPVHLFCKKIGVGRTSGGETNRNSVLKSNRAVTKRHLKNLQKLTLQDAEFGYYPIHEHVYSDIVARHNLGLSDYREIVLEGLKREGFNLTKVIDLDTEIKQEISEEMKEIKEENYSSVVNAIVDAESLSETDFSKLEGKQELTEDERHQLKHGKLEKRYGVEPDQELVREDDKGLYNKLQLQFWLTVGRDHVAERDKEKADSYLEKTEGNIFRPDFNRTQKQAKVQILEALKIPDILKLEGQEITNETLADWWEHIKAIIENPRNCQLIKQHLGVTVSEKSKTLTAIRILDRLCDKVGMKLTFQKQLGFNQNRQRVYKLERISSYQDAIFAHWESKFSSADAIAA